MWSSSSRGIFDIVDSATTRLLLGTKVTTDGRWEMVDETSVENVEATETEAPTWHQDRSGSGKCAEVIGDCHVMPENTDHSRL